MKVAILVCERFSGDNSHPDDLCLVDELAKKGVKADIVVWDDVSVDYTNYTHAIIRSCWDYDERIEEFLDRMEYLSGICMLINPYDTIFKNHDKRYLIHLREKGVRIVPFAVVEEGFSIEGFLEYEQLIIKPTVSASGKDTYRVRSSDAKSINLAIKTIQNIGKTALVQEYIDSVETYGERSVVVISDKIMYAMKKTPAKGGFLVHEYKGGKYEETVLAEDEVDFVNNLIAKIEYEYVYMRVDFLRDEDDNIMLLELELIEPRLYISKDIKIAQEIVEKILWYK